jgi:RNA polymerase sigma factor (sigma-70 family)
VAFRSLFTRDPLGNPELLIPRVYAYVAYRIGDGPEAEDVTSETFERALRYRSTYDASKGDPMAWLIGIARRCLADAVADRRQVFERVREAAPGDMEEQAIRRLELASALAALEERERELIALRYGADLTARQIAELLGDRTNTIEVALHRTLARLRRVLERGASPPAAASGRIPGKGLRLGAGNGSEKESSRRGDPLELGGVDSEETLEAER